MNLLEKLRELRRRLSENFADVPDFTDDLAELGLAESDDPDLILDSIDNEIATLEASEANDGDTDV